MPGSTFDIGAIGTGAASAAINTGLGLLLEGHNDRRQLKQQQKLQDMQIAGSKQLTDYNMAKQLQMWKDTSYGAQVEQMQKAGLNPGLLYGIGGGGGQSMGNANGSVSGGDAPKGGGEVMGMALQGALMAAQIRNIDADTKNKLASNPNIPKEGLKIDTEIASLQQGITNSKTINSINQWEENIKRIDSNVAEQTQGARMGQIWSMAESAASTSEMIERDNTIAGETKQAKIEQIKAESLQAVLKSQQIPVETDAIKQRILQGWESLDNQAKEIKIKAFLAEYQANHPGLMQLIGGAIQRIADAAGKPLPGRTIH